jgi:energy-coupling factor transporter ATP-binding protein EcfA2
MLQKLLEQVGKSNFVTVVGPSGSGKSSLVRAGLVTALHNGALPGSRDWQWEIVRPGDDPLRALATPLVARIGPALQPVDRLKQVREMADSLGAGSLRMGDVLAEVRAVQPGLSRFVLIFDQFEETFTLCADETVRRAFLAALVTAAETPWFTVILTVRADFFGHLLGEARLGQRVDGGQVNVLPMSNAERRAAIEQPALNAGRHFADGLVQRIVDAVAAEPGELPLLEFALTELWERQTPAGLLTHEAYAAIGEVTGAIARRADQTLQALPPPEQAAVRTIFTRLVRVAPPDEGAEDTKRRMALSELEPPLQALVRTLADARLLVTDRDAQSGVETIEVAHEALIRNWQALQQWLNGDREFLLWRQRLRALVANWLTSQQDEGALLRGALLSEANGWLQTRPRDLSEQERAFVGASQQLAQREEAAKEAARQRELTLERGRLEAERRRAEDLVLANRQLRRRAIGLATALLLAVMVAGVALYYYDRAQRNADLATQKLAELAGDQLLKEARTLKLNWYTKAKRWPVRAMLAVPRPNIRPRWI